jgi:hypothetical protein
VWVGLVAGMGYISNVYRYYFGRTEEKFHFARVDMNGWEILKWIRKT